MAPTKKTTAKHAKSSNYRKSASSKAAAKISPKRAKAQRSDSTFISRAFPYLIGIIFPLLLLGLFWAYRDSTYLMNFVIRHVTKPYRRFLSFLVDKLPISLAEILCVGAVLAAIVFLCRTLWLLIRQEGKIRRLIRRTAGLTAVLLCIYCGFTLFWGVYFYGDTFAASSGLVARGATTQELEALTASFVAKLNELADQVPRDEDGGMYLSDEEIFQRSHGIYDNVVTEFPFLEGPERTPKGIFFSRFISYIGFTGFYFPFTGEATVNTDSPVCLLPSTVAHELSHQRGVSNEDEANFVAILACLHQDDVVYQYSGALLGYIHLSNALYKADRDKWQSCYSQLSEAVRTDLSLNSAYWNSFDSDKGSQVAQETFTKAYSSFSSSYGEENVMQRYEQCVELLVAYYYDFDRQQ